MPEVAVEPGIRLELSEGQRRDRRRVRRFVEEHVAPHAGAWDRAGRIPGETLDLLRRMGYLGSPLPREVGGGGLDELTYGLRTEEFGRGCSSVRTLLTVHDIVTRTVARWGGEELRRETLPRLAKGELLAAFALSEPGTGSDAQRVESRFRPDGEGFVLDGHKTWISFGQIADRFLVLARREEETAAFLVPSDAPGLERRPLPEVVGTRASQLAELVLSSCRVGPESLVGRIGFGFSHVVNTTLDHGRYSVAWGAVGIAQACLDACGEHTAAREQFGVPLDRHQLVRRKLTEMIAGTRAARLLCCRAGYLRDVRDPVATAETLVAKYFASRVATRSANDAVQLHGARGLSDRYPVERLLRDARVTEIIEGSTQIQQITIPTLPLGDL